jgi:hypothetical protein
MLLECLGAGLGGGKVSAPTPIGHAAPTSAIATVEPQRIQRGRSLTRAWIRFPVGPDALSPFTVVPPVFEESGATLPQEPAACQDDHDETAIEIFHS